MWRLSNLVRTCWIQHRRNTIVVWCCMNKKGQNVTRRWGHTDDTERFLHFATFVSKIRNIFNIHQISWISSLSPEFMFLAVLLWFLTNRRWLGFDDKMSNSPFCYAVCDDSRLRATVNVCYVWTVWQSLPRQSFNQLLLKSQKGRNIVVACL